MSDLRWHDYFLMYSMSNRILMKSYIIVKIKYRLIIERPWKRPQPSCMLSKPKGRVAIFLDILCDPTGYFMSNHQVTAGINDHTLLTEIRCPLQLNVVLKPLRRGWSTGGRNWMLYHLGKEFPRIFGVSILGLVINICYPESSDISVRPEYHILCSGPIIARSIECAPFKIIQQA